MGVKDLWSILTPYCERKPIFELEGKTVAIDLAGWVCESLNTVDYSIHPRQHLKNLFFRTCYILLAGVIPVFVLEGAAPELKHDVIAKRNDIQFRGVKPKKQNETKSVLEKKSKGRTRFNHVLKQCENLLSSMGLKCVQGSGEAEACCAHLNLKGLVNGVISQDSDCFAYGAIRVYRNFSVSSQGKNAAQGGAVDVYDMNKICKAMDFGQNKIVVMALLCGCDYCPDGIGGVGKDSVLKLFSKFKNDEILERVKSWREMNYKYTVLELKVDDKETCSSCGHNGKLQAHTRNGCTSCHMLKGCNASPWKEERLGIKNELTLRKKALDDPNFPSQEIIDEFFQQPQIFPNLNFQWNQPNIVKFIKSISSLLEWTELYSFQKFFPLLTRWQLVNYEKNTVCLIFPESIKKKRTLRGVPCYEILWIDAQNNFDGLIPDDQIKSFLSEDQNGMVTLWSTVEPTYLFDKAYPSIVESFLNAKLHKTTRPKKPRERKKRKISKRIINDSLNNMSEILQEIEGIEENLKKKRPNPKEEETPTLKTNENHLNFPNSCSTPNSSTIDIADLDDDVDNENNFDFSEIIGEIINKPVDFFEFQGKQLLYENVKINKSLMTRSRDDLDLLSKKRNAINNSPPNTFAKRMLLSSSFELLKSDSYNDNNTLEDVKFDDIQYPEDLPNPSLVNRFLKREHLLNTSNNNSTNEMNVSYFFENCNNNRDEFEKSLDVIHLIESSESEGD